MKIRLKHIRFGVDFRRNEATILRDFNKTERRTGGPEPGEAFLFISSSRNQLLWIVNSSQVQTVTGLNSEAIFSWKMRILNGVWNPLMLAEYAAECGVQLHNIKSFEESFVDHMISRHGQMRAKFSRAA